MKKNIEKLINTAKEGFKKINVDSRYKNSAQEFLIQWLSDPQFSEYVPQISHFIEKGYFDYLLDSFYQVIPFGTGGRRGEVGIGPNRINQWTIRSSAQGHSQYLIKRYKQSAKTKGLVLAYDVRQFFTNKYMDDSLSNPIHNLNCKDLAIAAAEVYAANGIQIYLFDDVRTTPELSFAIRHLKCVGGDMFSASHNPPEHNGKKVYDEHGGQLIPPDDEILVNEVTEKVEGINRIDFEVAKHRGLIKIIGRSVDEAYISAATQVSLSNERNIKIAYTPLHGCGSSSVFKALNRLGFQPQLDPNTSNPSGKFEHVTFNIPNPEVEQSFDTPLKFSRSINADILLNSDPDADRIGIMVNHHGKWVFLNGNEIAAILCSYVVSKKQKKLRGKGFIIKTAVTTNVIREICQRNNLSLEGNLLVGFKYIGDVMNKLEEKGLINNFLFACEESHGYISGNYVRDKDAVTPAIWLSELAAELKKQNRTLIDYLNDVYAKYGYFRNYLTEIRLPGAEGKSKIDKIQHQLRTKPPGKFGHFVVEQVVDYLNEKPIVSETDRSSKNMLEFHFKPVGGTVSMKVTVRPSGTEPKIKMYYEIGSQPFVVGTIDGIREQIESIRIDLEKQFMKLCYKIVGVDFPDRGFLLFWQLPLDVKLKYFTIEPQIELLLNEGDTSVRKHKLDEILGFLGSDPIEKVDKAFEAKYHKPLRAYLNI